MTEEERKRWLGWRHEAITASDAACLYNANPYKKLEDLYAEKIQDKPIDSIPNIAMRRGVELEPKLRQKFIEQYPYMVPAINVGFDPFEAANCEHPKYSFIRASLDGLSKCKRVLVEIKYVGKKTFDTGVVPKHYWIQVQHQMLASGAERGYVCMGVDENTYKVIPVERDEAFINSHIILCEQFWMNVQSRKAPVSSVEIIEDTDATTLAEEYAQLVKVHKELEEEIERTKEALLKFCTKDETRISKLNIKKILTKGSVDYSKIEALKNIDLEQFRKEPRISYRITVD